MKQDGEEDKGKTDFSPRGKFNLTFDAIQRSDWKQEGN